MARKNLEEISTGKTETGITTGEMFATIEQGRSQFQQQGTASPEEQAERAAKMKTQGRKGCKAVRINTAFSTENHQYIKVMSAVTGQTMTQFINQCIELHRQEHLEGYEKAKETIELINKE